MQCYLCQNEIGAEPQYIGNDTYRHKDCNPTDYAEIAPSEKEREKKLWQDLMFHADVIQSGRLKIIEILHEYHRDRLYRLRGCDTWDEFCRFLGMKRSWAYELLGIAKNQAVIDYVKEAPNILDERTKQIAIVARVATEENVNELMEKASRMTVSELRDEMSTQADSGVVTKTYSWGKDDYMTIEDAIGKVKREHGEMSSARAILAMAQEYLGG